MTHPADMTPEERAAATLRARLVRGMVAPTIIDPSETRRGFSVSRASSREDNGMAYGGRPRMASRTHAAMRRGAYGDMPAEGLPQPRSDVRDSVKARRRYDSYYPWQG